MQCRPPHSWKWALGVSTLAAVRFPIVKAGSPASAHAAHTAQQHDRRHMHMRNWALEPTGKVGVSPLDPNAIPKFVNELTKPPVFVPDNPGANTLHYTVTYKSIQQQLLPPGFPSTEVYAYGGKANYHTLGMTRLTVAAGRVGAYLLRDNNDPIAPLMPQGKFEMPLLIADRAFNDDGSIHFTQVGDNPDIHPYWDPEYFGDTIMVNGKVWPRLRVERRQYRFRIINASNARFYNLKLSNGMKFTQIGADGSYLPAPVTLTEALVAPAERRDILIGFSNVRPGTRIVLLNTANQPFPSGDPNDPATTGQVMRFDVQDTPAVHPPALPARLIDIPTLVETEGIGNPKLFTLNEHESDADEPLEVLIDGQRFHDPITELPNVATTEAWYFQNLTEDAHPVHIHLVEFQLEDRQNIDVERFKAYWESLNGTTLPLNHPTIRANVEDAVAFPPNTPARDFLTGPSEPPSPEGSGWKDTFVAPPGKVTRVLIRFAPQYSRERDLVAGVNPFPFDPTAGPGYVWHWHILDHEDNDMMRPMKLVMTRATSARVRQPATHGQGSPGSQGGQGSQGAPARAPAAAAHHGPASQEQQHR